jgi:hypothetical protein
VIVAFAFCWRTAAVVLATIPIVALGGAMYQKIALATGEDDAKAYKVSGPAGPAVGWGTP